MIVRIEKIYLERCLTPAQLLFAIEQLKGDCHLFTGVVKKGDSPLFKDVGSVPRMERLGNGPYFFV